MKKIVIFYITVLVVMLLATTLFITGCSCHWAPPQPYGPRVTGDGTGGAIVVYEDIKGENQHDFYVQKISPEGNILWGEEGVLIGSGYKDYDSFHDLHIVSDGSGGALVFWYADGSHITSVDSRGHVRWQKEVRWADYMISDGAGGAIIATDSYAHSEQFLVIKVDSEGKFPWGLNGVGIGIRNKYTANSLRLCGDDNGGAIIIWEEFKSEPGIEPHSPKISNYIYVQRINAQGKLPWGQDGVLLHITPEEVNAEEPRVTSDGVGGAIVTWVQAPKGKIEEGSPKALLRDIYAQRVDSWGNTLWTDNGMPLETHKGGGFPHNPLVISDGTGGAIVIWSMYAQKIDSDGNMKLQPGGVKVSDFLPGKAVGDGSGGVIVTFSHKEAGEEKNQLYVQRIDNTRRKMWQGIGTMVTERSTYDLTRDGQGGAIIAWGIGKSTFRSEKSYVQRISAEGNLLWGDKGIRLSP